MSNEKLTVGSPLVLAVVASLAVFLFSCGSPVAPPSKKFVASGLQITGALIPEGSYGRRKTRPMNPKFITIHSTQNFGRGADARAHARLLQRGSLTSRHNSLGYLTWRFTVDDHSIYQSLPTNEQGQHADYEGRGNQSSIGIEMCENRGNSRSATLERTAKLTAELMRRYRIPLRNLVPHQHWKRIRYSDKRDMGPKNCPHFS